MASGSSGVVWPLVHLVWCGLLGSVASGSAGVAWPLVQVMWCGLWFRWCSVASGSSGVVWPLVHLVYCEHAKCVLFWVQDLKRKKCCIIMLDPVYQSYLCEQMFAMLVLCEQMFVMLVLCEQMFVMLVLCGQMFVMLVPVCVHQISPSNCYGKCKYKIVYRMPDNDCRFRRRAAAFLS